MSFTFWSLPISPALALEQWQCATESFEGFGEQDALFVAQNLRKQFLLTVTSKEVLVKMFSKDFKGSEQRFQLARGGITDRYAIGESTFSLDTIVLPSQRAVGWGFTPPPSPHPAQMVG